MSTERSGYWSVANLAPRLTILQLERCIDRAAGSGLVAPASLRTRIDTFPRLSGRRIIRRLLDRDEFVLTESELERFFVPIALSAGLTPPQTQARLNGHRVDFFWPDLGLIVETDSLRWHRTAVAQARDAARDQDHARTGFLVLRFTHHQVRYDPDRVREVLIDVAARLRLK